MNEPIVGRIVYSCAGRDKNRPFVIVAKADCEHVLLSDGDLRKAAAPKKKKLKHIRVTPYMIDGLETKLSAKGGTSDAFIREALKPYEPRER